MREHVEHVCSRNAPIFSFDLQLLEGFFRVVYFFDTIYTYKIFVPPSENDDDDDKTHWTVSIILFFRRLDG